MYKILIIEDDTSMAKAMKKHLESWGNTVEYVKDPGPCDHRVYLL